MRLRKGHGSFGSVRYFGLLQAILAALICLLAGYGTARAQAVGIATISGTIVTPLSVTAVTPLAFGNVLQGAPRTVSRTAAAGDTTAAVFTISGEGGAGITIEFTLPQYLTNPGGARLPISFAATDCTIDSLAGTAALPGPGAWVGVSPLNLPAVSIGATNGATSVYLGGKITPAVRQAAGTYTGDIIISVSYDGT